MNGTQHSRISLGSHDRKLRYRAILERLSTLAERRPLLDIGFPQGSPTRPVLCCPLSAASRDPDQQAYCLTQLTTEEESGNNAERMERISTAVQEAQTLLADGGVEERVKHPGEGYLDSQVMRATSDLTVRCSEAVSGNVNTYDRHELAQHIRENPDFWDLTFPREVPIVSCLFGTFAPTPPEQRPRAPRRRAERQQAAELTAPETVEKLEKTEEGSAMVSKVNHFIKKTYRNSQERPLSYFHVVLDPDSFSRTVENVYLVSFLAKDGHISVQIDEEHGLPFITPVPKSQMDQRDISDENQFIVSLDMQRWRELIEAFNIRKPMMVLKRM